MHFYHALGAQRSLGGVRLPSLDRQGCVELSDTHKALWECKVTPRVRAEPPGSEGPPARLKALHSLRVCRGQPCVQGLTVVSTSSTPPSKNSPHAVEAGRYDSFGF